MVTQDMKTVFMGTPDFAVPPLKALVEAGYEVAAVVTQPDKPKGRGKTLMPTPVKEEALMHEIPVYQPKRVRNNEEFLETLKEINPERHRRLTGQENSNILDLARYLSEIGKPVWIRHVLIPKRSDYEEDLNALRRFLDTLDNVQRVEVLPYHTLGVFKWEKLGIPYPLEGISAPTKERVENAERILGCRK